MQIDGYCGKETSIVLPEKLGEKDVCAVASLAFSPNNPKYDEEQNAFFREQLASFTVRSYHV